MLFGGNFSFSRSVCVSVYSAGMRYGTNQVLRKRMVINIKNINTGFLKAPCKRESRKKGTIFPYYVNFRSSSPENHV